MVMNLKRTIGKEKLILEINNWLRQRNQFRF